MHVSPIVYGLFNERSALYLLLNQGAFGCEFHFHFDLLEAPVGSNESFADKVDGTVTFIVKAKIIVQVHAAFDDLTAAITFHFECVESLFRFGGTTTEEIFKEAHSYHPVIARSKTTKQSLSNG
jgi:hypothetical protein